MTKSAKKALRGKKKLMIEALTSQLGVITAACLQVGISRETHYRWLRESENYKLWVEELPELTLDFVENALLKQIKEGNITSIIFFLKTRGKARGYIERTEVAHTGAATTFNIIEKSVEEIKNAKRAKFGSKSETNRDPKNTG